MKKLMALGKYGWICEGYTHGVEQDRLIPVPCVFRVKSVLSAQFGGLLSCGLLLERDIQAELESPAGSAVLSNASARG